MYLSKLEILGFKSFASKTVVNFMGGMTGIVGPNGCGKTNIVDAIRWCLGEQKSSTLRSDKMENVIFNGTASKKPLGMAEVSLTIQNDRNILPSEYTEVVITRRIFRSGDSEYLLNRNICRLKDITNLFMDTGMGANAYSVIELKMVESILNNKTDERRNMFEEAAGVNKYKQRRRWTLKKLEDAKADLARVSDIISEVEKKVNSLERQAKRAEKHNKISVSLRELEIELSEKELALFHRTRSEQKALKDESFTKRLSIESDISRFEDELGAAKAELAVIEQSLTKKRAELSEKTEQIFRREQAKSISEEQKKAHEGAIVRNQHDITELENQINAAVAENERYRETIAGLTAQVMQKREAAVSIAEEGESMKIAVDERRETLKLQNEAVMIAHRELSSAENGMKNHEAEINRTQTAIDKVNANIAASTNNVTKTVAFIEELTQEKNETERRLMEAESVFLQKEKEKQEFEARLSSQVREEVEMRGVLSAMRDKIQFLQHVIDNLEGFSKGAKALLEDDSWHAGKKTLLANIGNTNERFRFAIEASLKNTLNSIIVETIEDIRKGISFLERTDQGKASFYLREEGAGTGVSFGSKISKFFAGRRRKKIAAQENFLGWSDEIIETGEAWKPFFQKLLSHIGIVPDLKTAFEFSRRYPGFSYVTLQGDYVDANGMIEGGAVPKIDETLFGRRQLLEELIRSVPEHEAKLEEQRAGIEDTQTKIAMIDMKALGDRSRMLVNDLANIEKQIHQFEFEKTKALDETESNRKELTAFINKVNQLEKEQEELRAHLAGYRQNVEDAQQCADALEAEYKSAEERYSAVIATINLLNLDIERIAGELRNCNAAITRNDENAVTLNASIERRKNDIEISQKGVAELETAIAASDEALSEAELQREAIRADEQEINKEFVRVRSAIQGTETAITGKRKERENLSELIHAADIKLSETAIKIENLKEHIKDTYSIALEAKEFDDLDTYNFAQQTAEVHSLKQQVKNLGVINPLAFSEFEEEKQRLDFLVAQRSDLYASERDLIKTIEEINITAQQLFMDTFEKIRQNFTNIFRNLFNPGDEADLKLEDSADPLEARIEIVAKPKGKRPSVIESLSGGEKTLTAIALLFSIYLVKPSPFCILDEIDAPLDDANVDRFTNILRDFSKNTQFIVVTHNKRTMEATDALYGVTMQEEGVSKLVSVKFNEDMNIVA